MSVMVVSHQPPAAIWDSAPNRLRAPTTITLMLNVCVTEPPTLSVTLRENAKAPADSGVPLITPFEAIDKPAGRAPEMSAHVYGGKPPVAIRD